MAFLEDLNFTEWESFLTEIVALSHFRFLHTFRMFQHSLKTCQIAPSISRIFKIIIFIYLIFFSACRSGNHHYFLDGHCGLCYRRDDNFASLEILLVIYMSSKFFFWLLDHVIYFKKRRKYWYYNLTDCNISVPIHKIHSNILGWKKLSFCELLILYR